MAAIEDGDRKSRSRVHDFCCTNVKGIVTVVMLFAMIICVVLIVMGECRSVVYVCGVSWSASVSDDGIASRRVNK